MYLSKLEIFGFKSFANRTVVNFTKGITGVVGPNGSGKTNIVDAIRWVLGEQKSSKLRSDKMESVIFNGTRKRKPMGMAEVSLTMFNDKGKLPTEYSEVTVTRRIFRSGESEYLLNKNISRLKDITNLFMDTGMGTNAYSVIELKMIETILSNKAEERRQMFEEAAGVNKYKLRRRLSLKKLNDVKSDLTRVNDIVSEVEKSVRSLERQAKKANRYNQIQSVLHDKELDLAEHQFAFYNKKLNEFIEIRETLNDRKIEIDQGINKVENELNVARQKISAVENDLTGKRKEISAQTDKIHELQKNISVSQERSSLFKNNLERLKNELEDFRFEKQTNEKLIEENLEKIQNLNKKISEIQDAITLGEEQTKIKRKSVEENKELLKRKNEDTLILFKELDIEENKLENLKTAHYEANEKIKKTSEKIQQITNKIAKSVGYLEVLEQEKLEAQEKLKETESDYTRKQTEKESLEKELDDIKRKELNEEAAVSSLKNKIDFLQSLITNLEGVSKGSKTLLESEGWTSKEKTLLSDAGSTDDKFKFALETALSTVLNNILIDNLDDLKKAIEYLKKNDLGKASFFLLENLFVGKKSFIEKLYQFTNKQRSKKLENEKDFINWALNLVKTSPKWKPYFKKILSNTVVTENLESALNLIKKYPNFDFVTLNGDLVKNSGIFKAGSLPKLDEALFGRKQYLQQLKNELPHLEENLQKLKEQIETTENKINGINLDVLSEKGKILYNDITNIEKQISRFEFEKEKATEEIDLAQKEIQTLAKESNLLDNKIIELTEKIETSLQLRKTAEEQLSELEILLKKSEDEFNEVIKLENQQKLELERLKGQVQNLNNSILRAKKSNEAISVSIEKRESEIITSEEKILSLKDIIEDYKILYDELNRVKQTLQAEEKDIENKLRSIKSEASQLETELNKYRDERQVISDKIHSIELENNKINLKLENLVKYIKEEYSADLQLKDFDDLETFNYDEGNEEVQELKMKIKNLGPINLLAYSEYEKEKERVEFLHKQRDDLIASEKDLIKTIGEINSTAENIFLETFESIKVNFKKIFQTLFDEGDEADLKLEEGVDPLESKIEIIGKPKGKRPTSIELLSGGEKTLTAIALLFAIYLVKPSPFCILDEVDAPLDDTNIVRFTKLLEEFSNNTQFIIVTHNKKTMEVAENMYGVTTQEEGISKLVGVQFNEAISKFAKN